MNCSAAAEPCPTCSGRDYLRRVGSGYSRGLDAGGLPAASGGLALRSGNVSGWYARLDRACPDRENQVDIWLDCWEQALSRGLPLPAVLPKEWPTLPASLLTDAGHVLDQLLCRFDAEKDGRSPRGAHSTPVTLVDAMVADELRPETPSEIHAPALPMLSVAALPPGFHAHVKNINSNRNECSPEEDEETLSEIAAGKRTRSGIPLPFAEPAVGGGLFPARLIRWHSENTEKMRSEQRADDTRILLSNLQLLDVCEAACRASRRRIYLELVRYGLASIDDQPNEGEIGRGEATSMISRAVRLGDSLKDGWPWCQQPRLLMTNPPWLRIKDRFRGHEDGTRLRKKLGRELRSICDADGNRRFSTLRGNVNLYRLFLERSLQVTQTGGRIRIVTPDSLLREKSSISLRTLLVNNHEWTSVWEFPESSRLFAGVSQGALVLAVTVGGETDGVLLYGPAEKNEVCSRQGLSPTVPCMELDRGRWETWSRGEWAIPRLPRSREERDHVLTIIDDLAEAPRLSDPDHWLCCKEDRVRIRVGEVDQTNCTDDIHSWKKGSRGVPLVRGVHFRSNEEKVWLHHPSLDCQIHSGAPERKQALWRGDIKPSKHPRLACQAIVNTHQTRRLRWVVLPAGSVIGNSVNHLMIPDETMKGLMKRHRGRVKALNWLCEILNSKQLDAWSRAWAANNNVNNYELELLPVKMGEEITRSHRI